MPIKEKNIKEIWKDKLVRLSKKHFKYKAIKQLPSEWVEENIVLTGDVSRYSGRFSYKYSPYAKEIIDHLHPRNPSRYVAVMKGAQSGITQGVIVPGMIYIISENPSSMLFTAVDVDTAKKTIETRLDPVMASSKMKHLIKPNSIRNKNQRTGDTSDSKEFAGGNLTVLGTNNSKKFRFFSIKTAFLDDWDAAKRSDKDEGSTKKLIEGRQTSFANLAKTFFVSTPTVTQTSNIYEEYLLGDQRKWNWKCPGCGCMHPAEWSVKMDTGERAGIIWKLDDKNKLIEDSVRFKFSCCGHEITENDKHEINLKGEWIPSVEPKIKNYVSYYMNSLIIPPGFVSWLDLVNEWLQACPPNGTVKVDLLKVFNNVRLGLPFKETGEAPKIMNIVSNSRSYEVGEIPDEICSKDGNGEIKLLTLAADLGGIMNDNTEDVRLDWEVLAHSTTGATYSIDHGSIGTFKRIRTRSKKEIEDDVDRQKWTYNHGVENSVWPEFDKIVNSVFRSKKGDQYKVSIVVVDTGYFTSLAYQYVNSFSFDDIYCFGVRGLGEKDYFKLSKDTSKVKKSPNVPKQYNIQVDLMKDDLASFMKLKLADDGSQHPGFMNFPSPSGGKYTIPGFFKHFEAETRREIKENGEVVGFKWEKRNTSVENHHLDVRIYGLAAVYILLDMYKRWNPKLYKEIDWAMFCEITEVDEYD